MTGVLRVEEKTPRCRYMKEECYVTEAGTGVLQSQEHPGLRADQQNRKRQGSLHPTEVREHSPDHTLILDSASRTMRQQISVALSYPCCDSLLWQP